MSYIKNVKYNILCLSFIIRRLEFKLRLKGYEIYSFVSKTLQISFPLIVVTSAVVN